MTTQAPARPGGAAGRSGRRAARRAQERRRRNRRLLLGVAGLAVAVAAGVASAMLAAQLAGPPSAPRGGADAVDVPDQLTLLLVREADDARSAASVTLLAATPDEARGFVLFVPVGTLADIPGVGLDRLGLALQYGGSALVHATVENALGVQVDHVATVSDAGLAAWLDRAGGLDVEVPTRLVRREQDGSADIRFEAGRQRLSGGQLAELWGFRERGDDELSTFPRQQRVLDALFTATADTGTVETLTDGGAPQLRTNADAAWLSTLLASLAAAEAQEQLRFSVLPVEPFGGDGPDGGTTYRLRDAATQELVAAHLGGSVPAGGGDDAVRVQVLNGVGVPGLGQEVDERLDRGTFRTVLTGNARSFDFDQTQIIVYDETDRSLAAARRVHELLGVGTIQVSRQPQSVVDLTVVIGADFVDDDEQPAGEEAGEPIPVEQ